jgi:hypothetical protein
MNILDLHGVGRPDILEFGMSGLSSSFVEIAHP